MEFISGLIASDERVPKKVIELADNLKKTYKAGSIPTLNKARNLAYWLYLYDEKVYCEEILSEFYDADLGSVDDELLSLNRIKGEWEIWKSLLDNGTFQGETSSPEKGIKNDWYNPKWIPITSDGGGNNLCIDLDPTDEGTLGQIIRLWQDDPQRTLEATTFTKLLQKNNLID